MKILLVGGGGRECAIAVALKQSTQSVKLYTAMKNANPQIARLSEEVLQARETDLAKVVTWAKSKGIELAVIGPEDPLGSGIADELKKAGISCMGPTKDAAMLEISKSFARNLMAKHKIPGLINFKVFSDPEQCRKYIKEQKDGLVVKPAGLTAGKGVKILAPGEQLKSADEAAKYAEEILVSKPGGLGEVVIEERAVGVEFTLQAFCDGKTAIPMPAVHDHKRAYEGDKGPNTGGMGSYSDCDGLLPFITKTDYEEGLQIIRKTIEALRKEGTDYRGVLYGQFMATADDIKVIEYNVRFGDPEAMNVLSILSSDFPETCKQAAEGELKSSIKFEPQATVCKYIVPSGYGTNPKVGTPIEFDEKRIDKEGAKLYLAAVNKEGNRILTTTSRAAGIVGYGDSIVEAERMCEAALKGVSGDFFVRHDIGKVGNIKSRVEIMRSLRPEDGIQEIVR